MRRAVVSGTSSGIGAAIARRLLREGWHVTGLDRAPATIAAEHFDHVTTELGQPAGEAALAGLANITALVHAAGFMRTAPLGALDHGAGEAMWRVHVQAAAILADTLLGRLRDGGRIVLIGSRTAAGAAGRSQYAATKAALLGLARSWAAELAPRRITVNVVAPGATETPMLHDPARAGTPPRLPPLGRFIQPEEVAGTTAFLLGEDASAITGQQITICGGASL